MPARRPAPPPPAPAKPARRSQADRTRESKQRLREAAIAVLMERGYAGLTTKEVIVKAETSNGALMHHYASKMELVIDATADIYEAAIERGQRIARSPAAHEDPVGGFIEDCLSVYFEWPFTAALEVLVFARTDPQLMQQIEPIMLNYRNLTNELWLSVFDEAGIPRRRSETVLNLTLNIVRGMAVNSLWQKDMKRYRANLADWASVARRMLADDGWAAAANPTSAPAKRRRAGAASR